MDLLDRMLGHDYWATTHLLELCRELPDAQLDQPFDIGHQTLRETFDHMIYNLDAWTAMMAGQWPTMERGLRPSIAALIDQHERYHADFIALARQLHDEQRLDDTFVDHADVAQSFGATIIHVLYHHVLHRSEVQHILQRLGVENDRDGDPQEWEHLVLGRHAAG
jgi:uncharacterized damage-inducible protein DinB